MHAHRTTTNWVQAKLVGPPGTPRPGPGYGVPLRPLWLALPSDPQISRFLETKRQERSKVFFVLVVILLCTESVSYDLKTLKLIGMPIIL